MAFIIKRMQDPVKELTKFLKGMFCWIEMEGECKGKLRDT